MKCFASVELRTRFALNAAQTFWGHRGLYIHLKIRSKQNLNQSINHSQPKTSWATSAHLSILPVTHLVVRSGRGAEGAQRVFTWRGGCVLAQGLGLGLSGGCRVGGRPLPLGGACRNMPVVDTSHVCDLLPSWRQIRVCLEWLLTPDIWCKTHSWMVG